jgi:hypothetical protein
MWPKPIFDKINTFIIYTSGKKWHKNLGNFCVFSKTAQSKQSPIGRKFAQTDHTGWDKLERNSAWYCFQSIWQQEHTGLFLLHKDSLQNRERVPVISIVFSYWEENVDHAYILWGLSYYRSGVPKREKTPMSILVRLTYRDCLWTSSDVTWSPKAVSNRFPVMSLEVQRLSPIGFQLCHWKTSVVFSCLGIPDPHIHIAALHICSLRKMYIKNVSVFLVWVYRDDCTEKC